MSDILILGGGINGLMTALECGEAGATVTLLEQSTCGTEASWAGGGILSPLYPWQENPAIAPLWQWSANQYPLLAAKLLQTTGIDCEYVQSGLLIADSQQDNEAAISHLYSRNIPVSIVNQDMLAQSHPGLTIPGSNALLLPKIAQIRNPRLLTALQSHLRQQSNINILEHHRVTKLRFEHAKVRAVETEQGNFCADNIIITTGAWTHSLFAETSLQTGVFPVKGQMMLLKTNPNQIPSIVLSDHRYIVPRLDGSVLVGSTVEHADFDKTTTVPARRTLMAFFRKCYPEFQSPQVLKHWAGIRPGSNGVPSISRHSDINNLFINCGHFRNGLNLAPASARLISDLLNKKPSIFSVTDYQWH